MKASIAIAANPDAAICAARGFSGTSIVPYGDEAKFLAPLPIALLSPTPELQETLDRWGIRRFQDLAALPPLGIAERLGPEGLRLRELARGEVERKLLPLVDPLRFEDEIELDYPVELLEPLAFVLARLINSPGHQPGRPRSRHQRTAPARSSSKTAPLTNAPCDSLCPRSTPKPS